MGYLDEQVELGAHIQGFRSTQQIYKTAEYELHGANSDEVMTTSISESKSQSVYCIEFLRILSLEVRWEPRTDYCISVTTTRMTLIFRSSECLTSTSKP